MSEEYKSQLFRLATVLYADNNYEVSTANIHRKIIESVLLEYNSPEVISHQIIDFVDKNYKIVLEEETIQDLVKKDKNERFHYIFRKGELFISLTEKRKKTLKEKTSNTGIDYFIDQFIGEYRQLSSTVDIKKTLHRFLYEVFSTNTNSFQKLIDCKKDLTSLINIESSSYNEKEKEVINTFLHWDNSEKNKAVFNISSYALEYCMLTNKNGNPSIHLESLRNKNFYLDTNIIYRALGINGEDRKNRSRTFLKKFNEAKEKLIISRITELEFKDGIKGHIDRIRKFDSPRVNSRVYDEVEIQQDIYNFYHKWRIGKVNPNLDRFSAEVLSLYDSFKKEFNIITDVVFPFDREDKNSKDMINDYASKIASFKQKEGHDVIGSSFVDSENIFWIECKRQGNSLNIFNTQYFLISTDQGLRRWDYQRTINTPIVLLPSQWLSILLRYVNRTDDDFTSFVSFLNLKNSEILISSEKLHIVLAGISEMTADIEQQRTLLQNLIGNHFEGIVNKSSSNDQVFNNAKEYAKTELEKQIADLQKRNEELSTKQASFSDDIEQHKIDVTGEIEGLKKQKSSVDEKLRKKEQENAELKDQLIARECDSNFRKWQKPAYIWGIVAVLIIIYFLLYFFLSDWEYNFVHKLSLWIETVSESFPKQIIIALMYSPLIGLWLIIQNYIWRRLLSKEKKIEKKNDIQEEVSKKFNKIA